MIGLKRRLPRSWQEGDRVVSETAAIISA